MFIYFYQNSASFEKRKEERKKNLRSKKKEKNYLQIFLNVFRCFWFSSVLLTPIIDGGNEKQEEEEAAETEN
jgi:hypothetical protein